MREILFRGRRIDNGEWVEGSLCCEAKSPLRINGEWVQCPHISVYDPHHHVPGFGNLGAPRFYAVDPSTVGQYTGLKDRNGVWIFEGDVVRCNDARGYIRFGTYASAYSSRETHVGFYIEWIVDTMLRIDLAYWVDKGKIEVIGNVHDNPELMEVGHVI